MISNKCFNIKRSRVLSLLPITVVLIGIGIANASAGGYVYWNAAALAKTTFSQVIQPMNLVMGVAWKTQFGMSAAGLPAGVGVMGVNYQTDGVLVAESRIDNPTNFIAGPGVTCTYSYDLTVKYVGCHRPITFSAGDKFENVFTTKATDSTQTWWDVNVNNLTTGVNVFLGSVQISTNTVIGGVIDYTYPYGFSAGCPSIPEPKTLAIYSPPYSDGIIYNYAGTAVGPCGVKMATYQPSQPNYDNRIALELLSTNPGVQNYVYSLDEIFSPTVWTNAFDIASRVASAKYDVLLAGANAQSKALQAQIDLLQVQSSELGKSVSDLNLQILAFTSKLAQSDAMQVSSAKQNAKLTQCVFAIKKLLNSKIKVKAPAGC